MRAAGMCGSAADIPYSLYKDHELYKDDEIEKSEYPRGYPPFFYDIGMPLETISVWVCGLSTAVAVF